MESLWRASNLFYLLRMGKASSMEDQRSRKNSENQVRKSSHFKNSLAVLGYLSRHLNAVNIPDQHKDRIPAREALAVPLFPEDSIE